MTAVNSSQIAMSSSQAVECEDSAPNSSQFVTSSKRHRGAAYRPWAFTEHGAIMAATVLSRLGQHLSASELNWRVAKASLPICWCAL